MRRVDSTGSVRGLLRVALLAIAVLAVFPVSAYADAIDPPTDLVVTPGTQDPVVAVLSWTASPSPSVTAYRVYQSAQADGPYRRIATTTEPVAEVFRGLAGIPYHFRVTAMDDEGDESEAVQAGPVTAQWTLSPHKTASTTTNLCSKCHNVHGADNARLTSPEVVTEQTGPTAVCVQCHAGAVDGAPNVLDGEADSFSHGNGHVLGEPTHPDDSTIDCVSCHRTHGSADDSPMLPAGELGVSHVENCVRCHDDAGSWTGESYPDAAEPSKDASGYPVAGTWRGIDVYNSPYNAHARITETTQTTLAGTPVDRDEGDCLYCHAGHGSASRYDSLRSQYGYETSGTVEQQSAAGAYASLCLDCHGATQPARFAQAADIYSFVASDSPNAGHRIVSEGALLPVGASLPCYECHGAHGSSRGNDANIADSLGAGLSTQTPSDVRAFCLSCHTTSDTQAGWDSDEGDYRPVGSSEEVVGLLRTEGALALSESVSAHEESSDRSCYECHGDDYSAGGNNVHSPKVPQYEASTHTAESSMSATLTVSAVEAQLACSSCHELELAAEHAKSTSSSAAASCMACHPEPRDSVGDWDKVSCATGDCHAVGTPAEPHGAIEAAHESAAQGCSDTGCHSTNLAVTHSLATTTAAGVERTSCLVCHDSETVPSTSECTECHQGYSAYQHAYSVPGHTAETTGTVEITTTAGLELYNDVDCASCHGSVELGVVHNTVCASCHPVVVPDTVDTWDGTCAQAGCHSVADTSPQHEGVNAAHDFPAPAEKDCFESGCHATGSLAALHSSATTEVAGVTYESCQVCHQESLEAVEPEPQTCLTCHPSAVEDHD